MKAILFIISFWFSSAFATNYYVSATGSDAANGTIGTPWQTISKVNSYMASLQPGDSILLNRGDSWTGTITVGTAGTSGNNIVISAYGIGAKPIITASVNNPAITVTAANRGYWTVDNIDWRSSGTVAGISQNASIYFNYWPSEMGVVPGWVIQNCIFNSSIHVSGPNTIIRNNTFAGNTATTLWGAICIRGTNGAGVLIEGNNISNYTDRGIWFYNGVQNATVRYNTINNIAIGPDQHGAGINNDGANTPNPNAKIYGNVISNCGYGISHESAFGCETYSNSVSNCEVGMTSFFYPASYYSPSNVYIHNNTISTVQYGFALWHTRNIDISNNTIYQGNGAAETAGFVQNADTANVASVTFSSNIVAGTWLYPVWNYLSDNIFASFNYNDIVPVSGGIYRSNGVTKTLTQTRALGYMTNGITSDPLFVSPGTDFHLQSGSPALSAGPGGAIIGALGTTPTNILIPLKSILN